MKRRFCSRQIVLSLLLICMAGAASAANITYTYDAAGRLTTADYGGGKSIAYTYDNNGNLLQQVTAVLNINAADCLFNWAERNLPSLFSPAAASLTLGPYYFRYYSGTNIYLGVATDDHVYYLDALGLHDVGVQSGWFAAAGCQ